MRERLERLGSGSARLLREHWLFATLVLLGLALRVVVALAYRPAILGITDSYWYLEHSEAFAFEDLRPLGYSVFLRVLPLGLGLEVVPFVQHALGLITAGILYALLLRLGVRAWLAAAATAPVLLDAYVLNIEHQVLAEAFFHLLIVGACAALLWRKPIGLPSAALAGLLLALAVLTRQIVFVAIVPAVLTVLLLPARRYRLLAAGTLVAAFAAPLLAYATLFYAENGVFALSREGGRYLYGRVAQFADCSQFELPARERVLCPRGEPGERLDDYGFMWGKRSPVRLVETRSDDTEAEVAGNFARRVIKAQPLDYADAVLGDFMRGFAPMKTTEATGYRVDPWKFHDHFPTFYLGNLCSPENATRAQLRGCRERAAQAREAIRRYGGDRGRSSPGPAEFLQQYGRFAYVPGPLLFAGLVVALAATLGLWRARRSDLRVAVFLFASLSFLLALGAVAISSFSWRYQLQQLFLIPPATGLAVTAFWRRPEESREEAPAPRGKGFPEAV